VNPGQCPWRHQSGGFVVAGVDVQDIGGAGRWGADAATSVTIATSVRKVLERFITILLFVKAVCITEKPALLPGAQTVRRGAGNPLHADRWDS
jgi:hypothetical protein